LFGLLARGGVFVKLINAFDKAALIGVGGTNDKCSYIVLVV